MRQASCDMKEGGLRNKVAVIGSGSWGTAIANLLCKAGNETILWGRDENVIDEINNARVNSKYLPGVELFLRATCDLDYAVADASHVYIALPSFALSKVLPKLSLDKFSIVISLIKCLEPDTGRRMSEVISEALDLGHNRLAVISGPNLALEVANDEPSVSVVASANIATANIVAGTLKCPGFYCIPSSDIKGVEICAASKNLVALISGIARGMDLGDNTRAALITLGFRELLRLVLENGGTEETVFGVAGLGDVVATCNSHLSRNNKAGVLLAKGAPLDEVKQTAEGVVAISGVLALAERSGVYMPIAQALSQVISGKRTAHSLLDICFSLA
ncbi:MAG: NAD(P)-dependent glycerol-3-phosphate dehydrogenase [Tropheryma whipplei]|nr:NAD(P)H-dependent glycerol-3-phosphate dehydrogenase [Tropheryma whipplei]MCO8182532.1 NAD(P)-dependent glycerol-3-phosphate dehydrogenase [Tropheryma whipplei]MCO8190000.1 NAD(P)-dependent glycerol-3-phosphate dehydrogenase [Tropheryma whipplei]